MIIAFGTGAVATHCRASTPALKNTYLFIMWRFLVSYVFPIPLAKSSHTAGLNLILHFFSPKRKGVSMEKNLLDLNLQD